VIVAEKILAVAILTFVSAERSAHTAISRQLLPWPAEAFCTV